MGTITDSSQTPKPVCLLVIVIQYLNTSDFDAVVNHGDAAYSSCDRPWCVLCPTEEELARGKYPHLSWTVSFSSEVCRSSAMV